LKNIYLKNSPLYFSLCLILFLISASENNTILRITPETTVYDFIEHASEAQWSSGAGALPFPGDPSDNRGFARYVYNALLEDETRWSRVLETHPEWKSEGWIMGVYPQQTVKPNTRLIVKVGFLSGATGTDGVRFDVYFDEYTGGTPIRHLILRQYATLDGKLDTLTKDLSSIAGKSGNFILYVIAGKTSNRDWAVWAEAKIEAILMPDLVITDIWESNSLIHYKIKNVGDAAALSKGFRNCLLIDGKHVTTHVITQTLQPGQEVEGVFDYVWQPAPGEHFVKVCADCMQNVQESNEENNCLEEKWLKENLPDLIIIDIKCDRDKNLIGYVIKNVGSEVAKGNHSTVLYVDGIMITHDLVGVDLKPGETFESWFEDYEWPECRNITVKVRADDFDQVGESNEFNNALEKICVSYPIPIRIVSGPNVVNITQDSATIIWTTNKKSYGYVEYSERSSGGWDTINDFNKVEEHVVKITGLKPRTTYMFIVSSKDSCGNIVTTNRTMVFETAPPPDDRKPWVRLIIPDTLRFSVDVMAEAGDDVGVEGVSFLVDGVVKFMALSPPRTQGRYVWACDTRLLPNGPHVFSVVAFDAAGNTATDARNVTIENPMADLEPPIVRIVKPNRSEVNGLVQIEAVIQDLSLSATYMAGLRRAEVYIDNVLVKRWEYASFDLGPFGRRVFPEGLDRLARLYAPTNLTLTYLWDTTGLEPLSEHTIEVKAWDYSDNLGKDSKRVHIGLRDVKIGQLGPLTPIIVNVDVTREVRRSTPTTYLVTLTVKNTGTVTLCDIGLVDYATGFQAIPLGSDLQTINVHFEPGVGTSVISFSSSETLLPGRVVTFQYEAVPILSEPLIPEDHYIFGLHPGHIRPAVSFSYNGTYYRREFELMHHPEDLSSAFGSADYIIITSPTPLFEHNQNNGESVDSLLIKMAELAKIRNGVLGYLLGLTRTPERIKELISPSGGWARKLSPVFMNPNPERNRDAYVLIVGETEIVPSVAMPYRKQDGSIVYIDLCDQYYSDVDGDWRPELIVGRIIGNSAGDLIISIQSSIDVAHAHGFNIALGASGYEDDGATANVINDVTNAVQDIQNKITGIQTKTLHWAELEIEEHDIEFNEHDAFVLGDVNDDGIDEIIVASDEQHVIRIYEPSGRLIRQFPCSFARSHNLLMVRGLNIVIARQGQIDPYNAYGGSGLLRYNLIGSYDQIAAGDVLPEEDETNDEIVIIDDNLVTIYSHVFEGGTRTLRLKCTFTINFSITSHDVLAVGDVRPDLSGDEIVIIRNEDKKIYIYSVPPSSNGRVDPWKEVVGTFNRDNKDPLRYNPNNGFAIGDVDKDGDDDIIVICNEDKRIYRYFWNGTDWCRDSMKSSLLDRWFSSADQDSLAIGRVIPNENPKITIARPNGKVIFLASTFDDADRLANKRVKTHAHTASFIVIFGHGNPQAASPFLKKYENEWGEFVQHPFIFAVSCIAGNYEDIKDDNLGEAFFKHGAGVYIGATELVYCCEGSNVIKEYFEKWDIENVNAGKAFTLYERYHRSEYWAKVYNYYGDPKFPMAALTITGG